MPAVSQERLGEVLAVRDVMYGGSGFIHPSALDQILDLPKFLSILHVAFFGTDQNPT